MAEMRPRARVLMAFAHKEPDRVPLDLMGTASGLADPAYFNLRGYMGLTGNGRMFRKGENVNYYDERVLEALDVDFRRVWLRAPANWAPVTTDEGAVSDEWGTLWLRVGNSVNYVNAPLESASISDLRTYPWPNPYDLGRVKGLAEEARRLHESSAYAISARSPTHGIFDLALRLRGMERFLMDLVLDALFATALVHKIKEILLGYYQVYLDAVGPYVDMVETVDDYGAQNAPLVSPQTFRDIVAPARRELNALIRSKAPNAKIFLHSDGAIFDLIPHLIDTGVEVLNPVEPDANGNSTKALKQTFGSELIFHGHLDTKGALRGPSEGVRTEVRRVVDGMASGGGYVMAPTNHLQTDVSPGNIIEAYRYACKYSGRGSSIPEYR